MLWAVAMANGMWVHWLKAENDDIFSHLLLGTGSLMVVAQIIIFMVLGDFKWTVIPLVATPYLLLILLRYFYPYFEEASCVVWFMGLMCVPSIFCAAMLPIMGWDGD